MPTTRPLIERLESRVFLSVTASRHGTVEPAFQLLHHSGETADGTSAPAGGISPAEMQRAYGINTIQFGSVSGTGAGQTIAIVDAYNEPNIASDLANFDSYYGLPAPRALPSWMRMAERCCRLTRQSAVGESKKRLTSSGACDCAASQHYPLRSQFVV